MTQTKTTNQDLYYRFGEWLDTTSEMEVARFGDDTIIVTVEYDTSSPTHLAHRVRRIADRKQIGRTTKSFTTACIKAAAASKPGTSILFGIGYELRIEPLGGKYVVYSWGYGPVRPGNAMRKESGKVSFVKAVELAAKSIQIDVDYESDTISTSTWERRAAADPLRKNRRK